MNIFSILYKYSYLLFIYSCKGNKTILKISQNQQANFVKIAEQILLRKEKVEDTSLLEQEIDKMVYELNGLNEEEIRIFISSQQLYMSK